MPATLVRPAAAVMMAAQLGCGVELKQLLEYGQQFELEFG
jgi:hypothetical protein